MLELECPWCTGQLLVVPEAEEVHCAACAVTVQLQRAAAPAPATERRRLPAAA